MKILIDIPDHYYENNIKKELPVILTEDDIVAILPQEREEAPFDFELYEAGLMSIPKEMIKILDKIRSEVEELKLADELKGIFVRVNNIVIEKVLDIIEKYGSESEE